jgi:hypothetical protein
MVVSLQGVIANGFHGGVVVVKLTVFRCAHHHCREVALAGLGSVESRSWH